MRESPNWKVRSACEGNGREEVASLPRILAGWLENQRKRTAFFRTFSALQNASLKNYFYLMSKGRDAIPSVLLRIRFGDIEYIFENTELCVPLLTFYVDKIRTEPPLLQINGCKIRRSRLRWMQNPKVSVTKGDGRRLRCFYVIVILVLANCSTS